MDDITGPGDVLAVIVVLAITLWLINAIYGGRK